MVLGHPWWKKGFKCNFVSCFYQTKYFCWKLCCQLWHWITKTRTISQNHNKSKDIRIITIKNALQMNHSLFDWFSSLISSHRLNITVGELLEDPLYLSPCCSLNQECLYEIFEPQTNEPDVHQRILPSMLCMWHWMGKRWHSFPSLKDTVDRNGVSEREED